MKRFGPALFALAQIFALGGLTIWAAQATWQTAHRRALPELRNEPLIVAPRYDNPLVVSDEQLRAVLTKLMPRFGTGRPPVSTLDHALRFWGVEAKFADPTAMSGAEMRQLLVDNRRFVQASDQDVRPLLIDTPDGVRFRTFEGVDSSSHVDHTLACLVEVGTPLDYPVVTPERTTTVRAMLDQSLREFSLNQTEYEWSAMVYAIYLQPPGTWTTWEGQRIDFDRIAHRIMRQRLPQGVCRANHRLYALVVLLRIDEDQRLLSDAGREEIIAYLQDASRLLTAHQHPDGYWDADWAHAPLDESGTDARADRQAIQDRILVTGHALEWWALAPESVLPPRETIVRTGQWTAQAIERLSDAQVIRRYGPLSHAGRALALWRGKWPHEIELGAAHPESKQPAHREVSRRGDPQAPRGALSAVHGDRRGSTHE